MGRPPKATEDKRQPVTLRLDPRAILKLKELAHASGRSVGKEVEARVEATLDFDAQGLELVSRIGSEIGTLQRLNNGKRWHSNLACWASVAELLAEGPIHDMMPDNEIDQEVQLNAAMPVLLIDERRRELANQLVGIGIAAVPERKFLGLLRMPKRSQERAAIDLISDGDLKAEAIALHDELKRLDDERDEKLQSYREAMEPYYAGEDAGRQICRDYLYEEARRKQGAGGRFNWSHLLRKYQSWR